MTDKTEAQPEALRLADERPCSIDDDLYAWSQSAEQMIRDQHAEIQQLKAQLADETETSSEWRRLALQFDGHRIQALSHLKLLTKHPSDHRAAAVSFLAAPPLSGEQVLANRLAQLSARQAAPDWIEDLAQSWDECMYDAPGEMIDIGASIRKAASRAAPPPPEREPLTELQKQALAVYLPPFQFSHGYVFDSAGRMVADEGREHELEHLSSTVGMRIRGWGHLGKLKNGAEVQDTIGELAAEALNAFWKQHGIGATND